jgi:heptosyltransferase-2
MTRHILVVAPSWIGDMVMAQPLLARLQANQQPHIDVLALPWIKPLLSRMPGVDGVVDMPIGHGRLALSERYHLGKSLRGRYAQAIVLPNTLKSALIPWFARIPRRTGYTGESRYGLLNDRRTLDKEGMPKLVTRYAALASADHSVDESPLYPILQVTPAQQAQTCQDLDISVPDSGVLGLCPGAEFGEAKRWPVEHYVEVARHALDKGQAVWLFGSEKDQAVTRQINELCGGQCLDLAGKTTLDQAIDLMSLTQTVITNDSGLMHVACALGRRVIALFGSSSPAYTPPLSDQATVLSLGLDCSPCFERSCPLGHLDCLQKLPPEMVIGELG